MTTYRSKLLACFLYCMTIPAVLGFLVYMDLKDRRGLETSLHRLEAGAISLQDAIQSAHDFFNFAQRDRTFFESGESQYLTAMQGALDVTRAALSAVQQEGTTLQGNRLNQQVLDLTAALDSYATYQRALAENLRTRGYMDFGIAGDMRRTIHEVESGVTDPALLVHTLTMRRHEKDYIIRNDEHYVALLEARAAEFRRDLAQAAANGGPSPDLLGQQLDTYVETFRRLVNMDEAIGIRGGGGQFAELGRMENDLKRQFSELQSRLTEATISTSEQLTNRLFVSIVIVLLISLALSAYLSRSLTRPLRRLSSKIRHYAASGFSQPIVLEGMQASADEVGQIARDFDELQNTLSCHVDSLRQQKEATEAINEELLEKRAYIAQAKRMARLAYWRWDSSIATIEVSDELNAMLPGKVDPGAHPVVLFLPMIHPDDRDRFETDLSNCINQGEAMEAEYRLDAPGDEHRWIRQHVMTEAEMGKPEVLMATVQDISQQRNAEEQIRKMAYYDILTGLATRGSLNRRLNEMIRSAKRRSESFALFFLDLDKFKEVNDSLGHEAGDNLLIEVASRLQRAARETDFVARLGGDEFCMLFEDVADEVDIATIAERCLQFMGEHINLGGRVVSPRGSIGIARYPIDGTDAKSLMQAGDNAMYAAKQAGMHSFEFHNSTMSEEASRRLALSAELRAAVRNGQFVLHYQPQVDLSTGRVSGFEALIRWQHPTRGLQPPAAFIAEIERLGLIKDLGDWVIRAACQQLADWNKDWNQEWRREGQRDDQAAPRVSINVAPRQLNDSHLFETIRDTICETGIAPDQLEIEVTETGIQSAPMAREILAQIRALGVDVAIDDFGTGYSSLGSLKSLPVNCLKIDRSFITDAANRPEDAILLQIIVSLGRALNFRIIAVGVEDQAQLNMLRDLDCRLAQGFIFSRPVSADEVFALAKQVFPVDHPLAAPTSRRLAG